MSGKVFASILQIVVYGLLLCRGVFVDNTQAVKATMKVNGFTEYHIKDKDVLFVGLRGCQIDEAAKFEVTATNTKGEKVDFLVCTGWPLKGATIRTDW